MKKKIIMIMLSLTVGMNLAACGKTTDTTGEPKDKARQEIELENAAGKAEDDTDAYDSILELQLKYEEQEAFESMPFI